MDGECTVRKGSEGLVAQIEATLELDSIPTILNSNSSFLLLTFSCSLAGTPDPACSLYKALSSLLRTKLFCLVTFAWQKSPARVQI